MLGQRNYYHRLRTRTTSILYGINFTYDPTIVIDRDEAARKWMEDGMEAGAEGARQIEEIFNNHYQRREEENDE